MNEPAQCSADGEALCAWAAKNGKRGRSGGRVFTSP